MSSLGRTFRRLACKLPEAKPLFTAVICVIVPGLTFIVSGWRKVGVFILAGCVVSMLTFFTCLGHPIADWAYMAVLSAHVTSISQLIQPRIGRQRFVIQCVAGVLLFGAMSLSVYVPAREWIYSNIAMPLQTSNGVVVVKPCTNSGRVVRGDVVAYRFEGHNDNGIAVRSGFGLGPVLAVPGDQVKFGRQQFQIGGVLRPSVAHMPATGEIIVPEKYWFIWPDLHIGGNTVAAKVLADEMQRLALVEQGSFVGRPYKRWFFRKQSES